MFRYLYWKTRQKYWGQTKTAISALVSWWNFSLLSPSVLIDLLINTCSSRRCGRTSWAHFNKRSFSRECWVLEKIMKTKSWAHSRLCGESPRRSRRAPRRERCSWCSASRPVSGPFWRRWCRDPESRELKPCVWKKEQKRLLFDRKQIIWWETRSG